MHFISSHMCFEMEKLENESRVRKANNNTDLLLSMNAETLKRKYLLLYILDGMCVEKGKGRIREREVTILLVIVLQFIHFVIGRKQETKRKKSYGR